MRPTVQVLFAGPVLSALVPFHFLAFAPRYLSLFHACLFVPCHVDCTVFWKFRVCRQSVSITSEGNPAEPGLVFSFAQFWHSFLLPVPEAVVCG